MCEPKTNRCWYINMRRLRLRHIFIWFISTIICWVDRSLLLSLWVLNLTLNTCTNRLWVKQTNKIQNGKKFYGAIVGRLTHWHTHSSTDFLLAFCFIFELLWFFFSKKKNRINRIRHWFKCLRSFQWYAKIFQTHSKNAHMHWNRCIWIVMNALIKRSWFYFWLCWALRFTVDSNWESYGKSGKSRMNNGIDPTCVHLYGTVLASATIQRQLPFIRCVFVWDCATSVLE